MPDNGSVHGSKKKYIKRLTQEELDIWRMIRENMEQAKINYDKCLRQREKFMKEIISKYDSEYSYLTRYTLDDKTGNLFAEEEWFPR